MSTRIPLKSQDILMIMVVTIILLWTFGISVIPYTILTWLTTAIMVIMMALALVAPLGDEEEEEEAKE